MTSFSTVPVSVRDIRSLLAHISIIPKSGSSHVSSLCLTQSIYEQKCTRVAYRFSSIWRETSRRAHRCRQPAVARTSRIKTMTHEWIIRDNRRRAHDIVPRRNLRTVSHSPAIRTDEMQRSNSNIESIRQSREGWRWTMGLSESSVSRARGILYRADRLHSTLNQRRVNLSLTRMSKQLSNFRNAIGWKNII